MQNDLVAVIAGPTASGKTALSIRLAGALNGEIISADSMQIYRRMDIGTAKADAEEQAAVPHHMIDVAEPCENYSAARYVEEAGAVCDALLAQGKLPVITGGTGLYIDSLVSGRTFADAGEEDSLRAEITAEYERRGGERMLEELRTFDPERAGKLAPTDSRRIIRAIEVYRRTGITATEHDEQTKALPPRYRAARIILSYRDRSLLYDRINRRVDRMEEAGLFEEVESLLKEGLSPDCTAMQAIGYKEAAQAIRGEITREEALEQIKLGSRRYAKRQLTWFRRAEGALWLYRDELSDNEMLNQALDYVRNFSES